MATAAAHTLPGFSALDGLSTDDDDNGDSTEVEDTEDGCRSSVADITDLTTAAARLQREKTVISQRGEARRNELEQVSITKVSVVFSMFLQQSTGKGMNVLVFFVLAGVRLCVRRQYFPIARVV